MLWSFLFYKMYNLFKRTGSFIVVLTFTTDGFYDEDVLKDTFEVAVKTGVFGDLKDAENNFWFKPLNSELYLYYIH